MKLTSNPRGCGRSFGHHGELLQGQFADANGTRHRALISLPCGLFRSDATFVPLAGAPLIVQPATKVKSLAAAKIALQTLDCASWGGTICVTDNIPHGWGLGSSTSDILAVIRAICDALGTSLPSEAIARMTVAAELAADPLMLESSHVLFAQREGRVLEKFAKPFPPMTVLGFNTSPDGRGIDTLALPLPRYTRRQLERFDVLLDRMRRANAAGDVACIGEIATESATINEQYVAKRFFPDLLEICLQSEAAGVQVAHSGTVAGLIFDPHSADVDSRMNAAAKSLQALGFGREWRFNYGETEPKDAAAFCCMPAATVFGS
jgi:uncharacterized protein involved in propanediol utilization